MVIGIGCLAISLCIPLISVAMQIWIGLSIKKPLLSCLAYRCERLSGTALQAPVPVLRA